MPERKVLTIEWVGEVKKPEGKNYHVLRFRGKEETGHTFACSTIKERLFPLVKVDAKLDTEGEIKEFSDGTSVWNISEIYENGEPIIGKTRSSGGGSGYSRYDPEIQLRVEAIRNEHIQWSVCLQELGHCIRNKTPLPHNLEEVYFNIICSKLGSERPDLKHAKQPKPDSLIVPALGPPVADGPIIASIDEQADRERYLDEIGEILKNKTKIMKPDSYILSEANKLLKQAELPAVKTVADIPTETLLGVWAMVKKWAAQQTT